MFYIDQETGMRKNLTAEEAELFNDMIGSIADGEIEDVENILEDDPVLAIAFNEDGFTALHFASSEQNTAGLVIVQILINYGANPYAENNGHLTPIHDINKISDQDLKAQFCEAMGIGINTAEIIKKLIHEKAHKIATEEVEARWAAKKAAEEAKTDTDDSMDSVDIAYQRATTFDEKVAIDPDRALEEYVNDPRVQEDMRISKAIVNGIKNQDVRMQTGSTTSEEATRAIESMYSKSAKSSQLEFSVDQGISSLIENMFSSSKNSLDDLIGTKASYALEASNRGFFGSFGNIVDYLSSQLSSLLDIEVEGSVVEATVLQLQALLTMAGSGSMPMGIPNRYNPDDDFEPYFGGGNNGLVSFDLPDASHNVQVVALFGNGTLVIAEDSESSQ
ncbi:MAG: hypothetical protein N4A31_03710 [Rickettsiales bacterium]|nr:hypothetical protein [Rickettsiales bacterium]